eukprot:COSAG01_NODE_20371_length_957_cov_3.127040_1_plen_258_part_01
MIAQLPVLPPAPPQQEGVQWREPPPIGRRATIPSSAAAAGAPAEAATVVSPARRRQPPQPQQQQRRPRTPPRSSEPPELSLATASSGDGNGGSNSAPLNVLRRAAVTAFGSNVRHRERRWAEAAEVFSRSVRESADLEAADRRAPSLRRMYHRVCVPVAVLLRGRLTDGSRLACACTAPRWGPSSTWRASGCCATACWQSSTLAACTGNRGCSCSPTCGVPAVASFCAAVVTDVYLHCTRSCHEILRSATAVARLIYA